MNGSYFLFLHVPYKFLLKTGHFEYYNVVTLKIRSLPSSGLFFLLAVGCSCLFSDFLNLFFQAVILLCVVSVVPVSLACGQLEV